MPDIETAKALLSAAGRDLRALCNMTDADRFPLEVFGFHAQQVVEKSLKAWLSITGVEYPMTHNIRFLIVLLQQSGEDISDLWNLVSLSAFAVQFRYEAFEMVNEQMDRAAVLQGAEDLYTRVNKLLQEAEAAK
jgi:HEPN domain-containing protein